MGLELDFLLKGKDEASGVFEKATASVSSYLDKFPNLTRNLIAGAGAAYALSTAYSYVSEKTKELIDLAAKKEDADLRMAQAMKTNLLYTNESMKDMEAFAAQIKKTYAIEDEQTQHLIASLAPFGMTTAEIKKAIPAILDFAKAKDIDAASAANLFGKAYVGHIEMLQRMGIVLDKTKVQTQGLDYILGEFNKKFGGAAQADMDSYTRKAQELGVAWDDIKKKAGAALVVIAKPIVEAGAWALDRVSDAIDYYHDKFTGGSAHGEDAATTKMQEEHNKQEQAARDHAKVMDGIDKLEKDEKEAAADGWEKQRLDLDKKFDEEETKLREQGVKNFDEFTKKKTAILDAAHAKWIKGEQDTAKAAMQGWVDEQDKGLDKWEKQREDAFKKAQQIADQYKQSGLDATSVWDHLLDVINEINKKEEEAHWQKAFGELGKITEKNIAKAEKRDSILEGWNGIDPDAMSAEAQEQKAVAAEKKKYEELRIIDAGNQYKLEQDWEAYNKVLLDISKKYHDAILQENQSFYDEIEKETGILSAYEAQIEKSLISDKYEGQIKKLNSQNVTGEDARIRDDQVSDLREKEKQELDAVDQKVQKLTDDYFKMADAKDAAAGTGGGGANAGYQGLDKDLADTYGAPWGNTSFGSDFEKSFDAQFQGSGAAPKRYATGGVADQPSIFGEAGPEAAVPLPDGSKIPVQLSGGGDIHLNFPNAVLVTKGAAREIEKVLAPVRKELASRNKI